MKLQSREDSDLCMHIGRCERRQSGMHEVSGLDHARAKAGKIAFFYFAREIN